MSTDINTEDEKENKKRFDKNYWEAYLCVWKWNQA